MMNQPNDLIRGVCSPEEIGLSSSAVEECLRLLDGTENEIHGIVMERHGKVFCETYLRPYGEGKPHTNHSLGKSYTCTGFGLACTEGLISPDERFVDVFADEFALYGIEPDENMRKLKMSHLMSMSVGMARMPEMDERWVENFLREPIVHEPGTTFLYNSIGSCLLGAAVEKRSGEPLDEYMRRRLFSAIGIAPGEHVWRNVGSSYVAEPGTSSTTRANLRLGMFYVAYGCVNGQQLIRVATKYPQIAKDYFYNKKNQTVEIIKLNGSIELAPIVGLAEGIVDIVETGSTLRENGLVVLEEVCPLSARVVVNPVSMRMENERITNLLSKLNQMLKVEE